MKFVLIAFVIISLHYPSSQYGIYSQHFFPYSSVSNYRFIRAHPIIYRYPEPTTVRYSVYKSFAPENRSLVVSKKTADVDDVQSHLDNLLSRMKSTMMQISKNQEQSATDQSTANPNNEFYKGKRTRKTLASFRSASV